MNEQSKPNRYLKYTITMMAYCLGLNLLLPRLVGLLNWPIYLDCVGTIIAAALGGMIPGIVTAFATNMLNTFFDGTSAYYTILNILTAIATVTILYGRRAGKNTAVKAIKLIVVLALIGGVLGSLITWYMYGPDTEGTAAAIREWLEGRLGIGDYGGHIITTFVLDLADKTISVLLLMLTLKLLPRYTIDFTWLNGWKQKPISKEEIRQMRQPEYSEMSLQKKVALSLTLVSFCIAAAMTWVSFNLFVDYSDQEHTKTAVSTASLVRDAIDPEMVDEYIAEGEKAPGYKETEKLLYSIRESASEITYVYVYKIMEDGCHVVFDLDTEELAGAEPGEVIPFDSSFKPYLEDLLAGRPIDPIETDDTYGWLLTAYEPVYDADGNCVCYAAADIDKKDILDYERGFLMRTILTFLGFFALLLALSLFMTRFHIVLPINSISSGASAFASLGDDRKSLDQGLERIRSLEISTGEEIEELYHAIVSMCQDLIDRMDSMQRQAETINEMQRGLILVMADMVESRDSNTGQHIHKTAAYTSIILRGLQKKGYYADQLTDKFIYDVQQSAPLHDVGKINVSDTILNKPGRFTDEEFNIMKSHTTAGKHILEQAMSKVHGESYLSEAINMAGSHHEKWDGTGYPKGLKGEDIPLSARIMAIADVFDALASKRVYKDPMPFEKAVSIIEKDAGSHFDPLCVEAFLDSLDEVRAVHEQMQGTELENL